MASYCVEFTKLSRTTLVDHLREMTRSAHFEPYLLRSSQFVTSRFGVSFSGGTEGSLTFGTVVPLLGAALDATHDEQNHAHLKVVLDLYPSMEQKHALGFVSERAAELEIRLWVNAEMQPNGTGRLVILNHGLDPQSYQDRSLFRSESQRYSRWQHEVHAALVARIPDAARHRM